MTGNTNSWRRKRSSRKQIFMSRSKISFTELLRYRLEQVTKWKKGYLNTIPYDISSYFFRSDILVCNSSSFRRFEYMLHGILQDTNLYSAIILCIINSQKYLFRLRHKKRILLIESIAELNIIYSTEVKFERMSLEWGWFGKLYTRSII